MVFKNLFLTFLVATTLLEGCSSMNSVEKEFGPLKTADKIDLQKFMGDWYVIANIPTFVEKGATNAIETYTWNPSQDRVDIYFRYNKEKPSGELKEYPQKGFIYNKETNSEWRVQPFWPLKFAYLILEIAPDYSYTVIGVPDRKYVWIMARKPVMDEALYNQQVEKLKAVGYDVSQIQKVPQIWNP